LEKFKWQKTTKISATVEHEFMFFSSQTVDTDDNIQNYVLVDERSAAKLR
jgi:competence transcription factor ComK